MDKITSFAGALIADESGVTAIEYGLIAVLVAVGAIAALSSYGAALSRLYAVWVAAAINAIANAL